MSNRAKLNLYVPELPVRPGQQSNFEHFEIPLAGVVRRPDVGAYEHELRNLPYTLIRVLDEVIHAGGPWDPRLPQDASITGGVRQALLTRPSG